MSQSRSLYLCSPAIALISVCRPQPPHQKAGIIEFLMPSKALALFLGGLNADGLDPRVDALSSGRGDAMDEEGHDTVVVSL